MESINRICGGKAGGQGDSAVFLFFFVTENVLYEKTTRTFSEKETFSKHLRTHTTQKCEKIKAQASSDFTELIEVTRSGNLYKKLVPETCTDARE